MAAFPLPPLDLYAPESLGRLFRVCETNCVTACCGLRAFDVSGKSVSVWLIGQAIPDVADTLKQFERLLSQIARHRGPVHADPDSGYFNTIWQTPYDALDYFAEWRQVIADELRSTPTPSYFCESWLTETVVALRDAIVAEKAFDRLPILADALEEAGCDNRFILDHLRGDDDHGHHCWVVDMLSVGDDKSL